jgi:hypothetical protein
MDPLEELKTRLSRAYIGKSGIHGVGLRRSQNAVCIYVDKSSAEFQREILAEVERFAAPFRVVIVDEKRPRLT